MSNEFVGYTVDERGIARITLNRPDKSNAFDDGVIAQLTDALKKAQSDHGVRVVVLAANGKHFSAGADLEWMKRTAQMSEAENLSDARQLAELMLTLDRLGKPTVARVQGAAFGGALGLICCCDIALASDTARFCLSEARLGLAPAAISPYVVRAMGPRAARRYFLTTEVMSAQTALELNVVHEVLPEPDLDAKVDEIAGHLLNSGPQALAASKELVHQVEANFPDRDLQEYTARLIAKLRTGEEGQEGLSAFLEKRKPRWSNEAEQA
ncbi:enoyl-CoA hydratase/isomerase family protein [Gilvimarinus sp. F26214L]|uniref:enoyl-CoA hydratase/isomerase family protein n=1 Tax=Gilvimarinus sp. DZF01 TaxID=3461371 RepID=UPI004045CDC3